MDRGGAENGGAGRTGPDVVVGVDGTDTALRAVVWAAAEARVRRSPLRIVHAAPYATDPAGLRRASAILSRAYTVVRQREPGVEAHTARLDGPPAQALAHAAGGAQLLVVGMLSGHVGDELVGSLAPAVVAAAVCPVTVVRSRRGADEHGSHTVVVGVQGVVPDGPALDEAFADADRHGCLLTVLHAGPDPDHDGRGAGLTAALQEALAPWRERHPAVRVEVRIAPGSPTTALLHASHRARNLVVGTRGRRAAAATLLGSTSRVLLAHGGCPVTVVRRTPVGGRPAVASPSSPGRGAPSGSP
jgi:nucleotide-binding universal stress UspA family protein